MAETLLAVLLGAGFLHAFYRAVQLQWPTSYFTLETRLGYAITATPWRYIGFRFAPVFVVCLFVAVTLDRLDQSAAMGVAGVTLAHVGGTSGRAALALYRGESNRRGPLLVLHCAVGLGAAIAAGAAWWLRRSWDGLVPPVDDLSASLWTGAAAAVLGVYILYLSQTRGSDQIGMLRKSRGTISPHLWRYAAEAAETYACDKDLLRAVMLIENLQRPRWFRRLERVKGCVFRRGTYGIMQISSDQPISDERSIERFAAERLAGVDAPLQFLEADSGEVSYVDVHTLEQIALSFNTDEKYGNDLLEAYTFVRGNMH